MRARVAGLLRVRTLTVGHDCVVGRSVPNL